MQTKAKTQIFIGSKKRTRVSAGGNRDYSEDETTVQENQVRMGDQVQHPDRRILALWVERRSILIHGTISRPSAFFGLIKETRTLISQLISLKREKRRKCEKEVFERPEIYDEGLNIQQGRTA